MSLTPIIADFMSSDHQYGIKVTYHSLFMCGFELAQAEDYKKILGKCAGFLCNFVKNSFTMNSRDEKLSVVMVLRIVGNFIALRSQTDNALNEFIGQLALQNETLPHIISKILKIDSLYKNEILWIAGNIYQAGANCRDEIVGAITI